MADDSTDIGRTTIERLRAFTAALEAEVTVQGSEAADDGSDVPQLTVIRGSAITPFLSVAVVAWLLAAVAGVCCWIYPERGLAANWQTMVGLALLLTANLGFTWWYLRRKSPWALKRRVYTVKQFVRDPDSGRIIVKMVDDDGRVTVRELREYGDKLSY